MMQPERELEMERVRAEGDGPEGQAYLATARRRTLVPTPALAWVVGLLTADAGLATARRRERSVAATAGVRR